MSKIIDFEWGKELKDLSSDDFGFLGDKQMQHRIALGGVFEGPPTDAMNDILEGYVPSEVLGEPPIHFNTMVHVHQLSMLHEVFHFVPRLKVIEVGAGIGNLSRIFRDFTDVAEYTILDIPEMSRFSRKFLDAHGLKTEFVNSANYDVLADRKFDLFISNICLSEIPHIFREGMLDTILPNCERLFVIDGDKAAPEFKPWLEAKISKNFKDIIAREYTAMWEEQITYTASKGRKQ
jgi:hypothetical protein